MTQREALLAIAKRDGGMITPAAVIEEARDEASVLHGAFTWDDTVAAGRWRVYEAQKLIRECRVTVPDERGHEVQTFAFVGLSIDRDGEDSAAKDNPYRLAIDVAKSPDLTEVAVRDALAQLRALERRYRHLKKLAKVWEAVNEVDG